jgi:hypothetical protein
MRKYIYLLPFILLAVAFVTAFVDESNFTYYIIVGNTAGCSIVTNILFVYYFTFTKKFCILTRLSPVGLLFINLFDIIGHLFCGYGFYNFWYIVITVSMVLFLSILFYIKNKLYK